MKTEATQTELFLENDTLIRDTLRGRQEAFGQLFRKHQEYLLNAAARMLRNRDEAEDVIQQVFVEAFRHLREFRHGSQFPTWLYAITLNRVRNQLRSRKNRPWVALDGFPSDLDAPPTLQIPDATPAIDHQLEKRLDLEWIRQELKSLPEGYQEIFELHYFQCVPLQDVARQVRRPLGTVKVYLHRARKELYRRRAQARGKSE